MPPLTKDAIRFGSFVVTAQVRRHPDTFPLASRGRHETVDVISAGVAEAERMEG